MKLNLDVNNYLEEHFKHTRTQRKIQAKCAHPSCWYRSHPRVNRRSILCICVELCVCVRVVGCVYVLVSLDWDKTLCEADEAMDERK